tara:strand:- start:334 stop:1152 length:819 start_codon:yes stop_codon:yes gene_type:complete
MKINIIDYRGDNTVINSRGDSLFQYRTRYFHRIQEDFAPWRDAGHTFTCFTQHTNQNEVFDDYWAFDRVIAIPRSNAATARNHVLDAYAKDEWIGIWDNDASVYFDKLDTRNFIKDLDSICQEADSKGIVSFVPFNAQQAPYPKQPQRWRPRVEQKTTQLWCRVMDWRFDETLACLEDLEFALRLVKNGHLTAQTELCSLKEYVNGKSTIFEVNAYHHAYTKPGPRANPKGLLQWDAQLDRNEKYAVARQQIEAKLGDSIRNIKQQHKELWK